MCLHNKESVAGKRQKQDTELVEGCCFKGVLTVRHPIEVAGERRILLGLCLETFHTFKTCK